MLNGTVVVLLLTVGLPGNQAGCSEAGLLTEMFQHAKLRDSEALRKLRARVDESRSSRLRVGYALSLYLADPSAPNRDMYVDAFPEDRDGIMVGLYEQIELKGLTPSFLYSFALIETLARDGNPKAMAKVLRAVARSDGVVAEHLCDAVVGLFLTQLGPAIGVLGAMPETDRVQAYQCLQTGGADKESLASLEAKLRSLRLSGNEAVVVKELTARVAEERTRVQ